MSAGAFCAGLEHALADQCEIVVKLDGDGQWIPPMFQRSSNPSCAVKPTSQRQSLLPLATPASHALVRLLGNAGLSFFSKLSSGYWNILDPTNGFIAIHRTAPANSMEQSSAALVLRVRCALPTGNHSRLRCRCPITGRYANEKSNLAIPQTLIQFPLLHQ